MRTRSASSLILIALAACLGGCPQPPIPPPVTPDASDAAAVPDDANAPTDAGVTIDDAAIGVIDASTACSRACAALSTAGCSLGRQGDCPTFLMRDLGIGKVPNKATGKPLTCADVQAVKTKLDAQKLGFVCAP